MALKLIDESLIDALITQAKQIHLNAVDYLETIRNRLLPLPDSSDQEQDEEKLEWFHLCVREDKEPVLREYGTLVCSLCRPTSNSIPFQTTKEKFEELKQRFTIQKK